MKLIDLINEMEADTDIYDNYDESIGVCWSAGVKPTEECVGLFKEAFDMSIDTIVVRGGYDEAVIAVDTGDISDDEIECRMEILRKLLMAQAGYCTEDEYDAWFEEEN